MLLQTGTALGAHVHYGHVRAALETNFLVPSGMFFVELLVALVLTGLLVIWPLVETIVRQQWGYTLGIVVFGPIGGLVWFVLGRRQSALRRFGEGSPSTP